VTAEPPQAQRSVGGIDKEGLKGEQPDGLPWMASCRGPVKKF